MIEISPEISGEALRFLRFMLVGFLLILAFDLLRILRRLIPHRTGMVAVEDMLYCIGSAIFIFIMLCRENDGAIRGFCMVTAFLFGVFALGMSVGMLLCNYAISPWLVKGIVKVFKKLFQVVGKPLRAVFRMVAVPLRFLKGKIRRLLRKLQKTLKKIRKTIRMVLCKL